MNPTSLISNFAWCALLIACLHLMIDFNLEEERPDFPTDGPRSIT